MSYKSRSYQTELTEAKHAINILGGKIHSIHDYDLPLGYGQRSLIVIEKRRKTPELYPRGIGIPKKRPLTL